MTIQPQSTSDILGGYPDREFILLGGKDGVGKSCAVVSIAAFVGMVKPDATFHVIDTESKFKSALRSFGGDVPANIQLYTTKDMNEVTAVARSILQNHKPGDWLAVESMARIWERAQDLGYQVVKGVSKEEYLDSRPRSGKGSGPIPDPERFWDVVKGAHDSGFLEPLVQCETLNVVVTTTMSKPPKEGQHFKESADRKAMRVEHGLDAGLGGLPALPYKVETLVLLNLEGGNVTARVLRDNLSREDDTRPEFSVPDRKSFGPVFFATTRNGEIRL